MMPTAAADVPALMLVRHAEKPQDGEQAVDRRGAPDENSLSVTGWMRAAALVKLFGAIDTREPRGAGLPRPRRLYAAGATASHPSSRPRDTLLPLSQALGLAIDESWSTDDPARNVAAALRALEEPALVCWRHDELPALAAELLLPANAPERWPAARHDLVWVISRSELSWKLTQVAQMLLPGDSTHTVPRRVRAKA